MKEDEGFLQRWSRRKQASVHEQEVPVTEESGAPDSEQQVAEEEASQVAGADAEQQPETPGDATEPEPPGDEDMPPLESIDEGGNVTPFMSPRVSEGLRRAALRRLFRQPKYNVVDMLDDYAEDYSTPVALGDIVTSDMRYRAEQAAKRMKEKLKDSLAENDAGDQVSEGDVAPSESVEEPHDSLSSDSLDVEADQIANSGDAKTPGEDSPQDPNEKPA